MHQPYILGIDIGTGSTKAVAVDLSGKPFHSTQRFYPTSSPKKGYFEQNANEIWDAFTRCLEEMVMTLNTPVAVSLSSAMHSVIPVDNSGHPLYPLITWADARGAAIAES